MQNKVNLEGVGNAPGIKVWRIYAFQLVDVPQDTYGTFYSGDSYVVLRSYMDGNNKLKREIFYWIGKDTTQDEAGSAAMFSTQLDEALGGLPVQYREVQGEESNAFKELFPNLTYKTGGFASGFKKVVAATGCTLYQVKAPTKTSVQVIEVPCTIDSINSGDVFILEDLGASCLYLWMGALANMKEKMKARDAVNMLKLNTKFKDVVVDEYEKSNPDAVHFYKQLGVSDPTTLVIKEAADCQLAAHLLAPPRLFKASNGGKFLECNPPLTRSMLDPSAVALVLQGGCLWVWVGHSSGVTAAAAEELGATFSKAQGIDSYARVRVVKDRLESGLFMSYFPDWNSSSPKLPMATRNSYGAITAAPLHTAPSKEDQLKALARVAAEMLEAVNKDTSSLLPKFSAKKTVNADTKGIQVWVVRDSELQELPAQELGHFYDAESYVVLHSFMRGTQQQYVIYFWQGRHSSNNEQGTAALIATEWHNTKYKGSSTLVRVVQNQEPGHFCQLFGGALVVRRGNRGEAGGKDSASSIHMYQVKGEARESALAGHNLLSAVEVKVEAASLSSGDCFVIEDRQQGGPARVYVWYGSSSSVDEQETARAVATMLTETDSVAMIQEGEEDDAFWACLGGKGEYSKFTPSKAPRTAPHLFRLRDTAGPGGVKAELSTTFSQDDLVAQDVFLLDASSEVFLWYGSECRPSERERAATLAAQYLELTSRKGLQVVQVEAGAEPPFFSQHFPGWDEQRKSVIVDIYQEKLKNMKV